MPIGFLPLRTVSTHVVVSVSLWCPSLTDVTMSSVIEWRKMYVGHTQIEIYLQYSNNI